MAFFRISGCDESVLETEVLRDLKGRDLPLAGDTELMGEFNRRHLSICRLLRQTDQERARLEFELNIRLKHIDAMHHTLSWRITKPIRTLKSIFSRKP